MCHLQHLDEMVGSLVCEVIDTNTSYKEAMKKYFLCEDENDLTSPTSKYIVDIQAAVSVVYDTLKKSFSHTHVHIV